MNTLVFLAQTIFLVFQAVMLIFVLFHDFLPLPPFNDVKALQNHSSRPMLLLAAVINGLFFAVPFVLSLTLMGNWIARLVIIGLYLWIFLGELRAWWLPYFFGAKPKLVEENQMLYGNTHAFLPKRHGIVPNTAHVFLHILTFLTLLLAIGLALPR